MDGRETRQFDNSINKQVNIYFDMFKKFAYFWRLCQFNLNNYSFGTSIVGTTCYYSRFWLFRKYGIQPCGISCALLMVHYKRDRKEK